MESNSVWAILNGVVFLKGDILVATWMRSKRLVWIDERRECSSHIEKQAQMPWSGNTLCVQGKQGMVECV